MSGYVIIPGLINAHDHLHFSTYPRLGRPPYRNYIEWGEDLHENFADEIAVQKRVPKDVRLWWGGIRNLLCGVTTVCHHDPLWPELVRDDFPVRVVQNYGWAHSLALGGDVRSARRLTPSGSPFIIHACEGVDELAKRELTHLHALGLLDEFSVLIHGLAVNEKDITLINSTGASLVVCPSSNDFLFNQSPDPALLMKVERLALGSDSPLTSTGDLLDEFRFAVHTGSIEPERAFDMVTTSAAKILRLRNAEGHIQEGGTADLVAIRDTGGALYDRLPYISFNDIELVIVGGRIQLASDRVLSRLPFRIASELEPLLIDGIARWLRAPIAKLLDRTEKAIGSDFITLGSRKVSHPRAREAQHAC